MSAQPPREPARCKSCDAPIWWARSAAGALSPFDAEPSLEGKWVLKWSAAAGEMQSEGAHNPERRAELEAAGRNLYVTHFATCPNAAEHRKPRLAVVPEGGTDETQA